MGEHTACGSHAGQLIKSFATSQMVSEQHPYCGGQRALPKVMRRDTCSRSSKMVMDSRAVAADRRARLYAAFKSNFPIKILVLGCSVLIFTTRWIKQRRE